MPEITITRNEYDKMIRTQIAAKMAIRLIKQWNEQGFMRDTDAKVFLDEFGADSE